MSSTRPLAGVAIDLQVLQVEGFASRGIGRYAAAHADALAAQGRVAGALLAPELPPASGLPFELVSAGLVHWDGARSMRHLLKGERSVVHHIAAPFLHVSAHDPSVLIVSPHWAAAGVPRAVTLYDLIPLRGPRHYLSAPGARERYQARARWVAGADVILAISEHTRSEAIDLLGCGPEQVITIGAGVSAFFSPPDGVDQELFESRLSPWVGRPFLFCVAGSDSRKNTDRLITAMGQVPEVGLVVAGHLTDAWRQRLTVAADRVGAGGRVVLLGDVSDDLLRACYRRATLTVMPSLAEGSGLPVLESAACGTPVAASATTALAEVSGTTDAQFDPTDVDSIADRLNRLLSDDPMRAAVRERQGTLARQATWRAVAERSAAAIDRVTGIDRLADAFGPTRSPAPRTVALFGPVAPHGGGLGRFNTRLVEALAPLVATTSVSPEGYGQPPTPAVRHVRSGLTGISVRPASFDGVVYSLGNSSGHLETARIALRHPGWLWLHETRLPALATSALEDCDDAGYTDAMERLLARSYPGRSPLPAARRAGRSNLDLIEAGVGLLPLLAERCRGLLVNSEAARHLVALDLAPLSHHPPLHVLPPAFPPVAPVTRQRPLDEMPLVATFGVVSWNKRPDLLVAAAKLVGCRLTFVGGCPPILEEAIVGQAERLGMAERVEVVGHVADAEWVAWMARTAVVVQLRQPSTGEESGAALEALRFGVPLVTNLASVGEYPEATRRYVARPTAAALAELIGALLASPGDRADLVAAGLELAASHPFERLAERLLSIVAP